MRESLFECMCNAGGDGNYNREGSIASFNSMLDATGLVACLYGRLDSELDSSLGRVFNCMLDSGAINGLGSELCIHRVIQRAQTWDRRCTWKCAQRRI